QQCHETPHVLLIEAVTWIELPEQRAELLTQLCDAAAQEALNVRTGLREYAPLRHEARCLDGEHEVIRRGIAPFGKHLGCLQAIERAVDLDGSHVPARIVEFVLFRDLGRIKSFAPRFIAPAADPDANAAL